MMNIRSFEGTDEAYQAWIDLSVAIDPEVYLTIDLLKNDQAEFRAENQVRAFLGSIDSQTVAYGVFWRSKRNATQPHEFSFSIHPDYRGSQNQVGQNQVGEIPRQMHEHLLAEIEQAEPTAIASSPKEDELFRTQLLQESGFALKMRFPRSRLDVTTVDAAAYHAVMAQVAAQEVEFTTLTDVMTSDPEWRRNVWQLFSIIERDIPDAEPGDATTFEEYSEYYSGDLFRPDSWAIAIDSTVSGPDRYVGMCVVNIMPTKPKALFAGITGVVPDHRRRKIATALKICSVKFAQQNGYTYIETDNEENNPMYDLNMQLGYEPLPAWVYYKREIN